MAEILTDVASATADYALRLGDDSLILGQRLSAWCGHAPMLELDLSLPNLALDLVGQATHFLDYAALLQGGEVDADKLAFLRDVLDYKNCLLVEQPNGDFAQTIARQFFFSTFQRALFDGLSRSTDATLAGIAAKAVKEVAYHVTFAEGWVVRLGDGTEESRERMIAGLEWNWRFVDELFAPEPNDDLLLEAGVTVDRLALRPAWDQHIDRVLAEAGLERPAPRRAVSGGRAGHHTEHLGHILSEMQFMQRVYPGATW